MTLYPRNRMSNHARNQSKTQVYQLPDRTKLYQQNMVFLPSGSFSDSSGQFDTNSLTNKKIH